MQADRYLLTEDPRCDILNKEHRNELIKNCKNFRKESDE